MESMFWAINLIHIVTVKVQPDLIVILPFFKALAITFNDHDIILSMVKSAVIIYIHFIAEILIYYEIINIFQPPFLYQIVLRFAIICAPEAKEKM